MSERTVRSARLTVATAIVALFLAFDERTPSLHSRARQAVTQTSCISCHSRSDGIARQVVALNASSSHQRIGCDACHGGDAGQRDKVRSHSGTFIARPNTAATLTMCGTCHAAPHEQYKAGKHFRQDRTTTRLDCVTCHGAHTIGAAPESVSFGSFGQLCAGCHGLEYLPPLSQPFRDLLAASDELRSALSTAQQKSQVLTPELKDRRAAIRRRISEIVHPTGLKGGIDEIPKIIEEANSLKEQIGKLGSKGER